MKTTTFINIALLSLCMLSCKTATPTKAVTNGTATIIFRTLNDEVTVHINRPIDDTRNFAYITDRLTITSDSSIYFELDVNKFAFVHCVFSFPLWGNYLVFPGDYVEVILNPRKGKKTISGNNAEGHKFYNDNYINRGLGYYMIHLARFITTPIDYDSLFYHFQQELILPFQTNFKKMEMSGSITPEFSAVMANNLYLGLSGMFLSIYEAWLIGRSRFLTVEPTEKDIWNILQHSNRMYKAIYAMGDDVKRMHFGVFSTGHYRMRYRHSLDDTAREKLTEGYSKETFGIDRHLLLASDSLQLMFFGSYLIWDLQNKVPFHKYDPEKMLAYLSNKFPDSEYVAIIRRLIAQSQQPVTIHDEVVVIDNSPSTIKELMQLPQIKGKYAYVSLWATWCPPCVAAFRHNNEIQQLLAQYDNIIHVYISIDTDEEQWRNVLAHHNLKGVNIMASQSLSEDIGTKVYNANRIGSIPRYLLLSPDGSVLNANMPSPSNSTQLKQIFDSIQ